MTSPVGGGAKAVRAISSQASSPRRLVEGVAKRALILTLAVCLILVVMGRLAWAKGLALGGLVSVVNFTLMAWLLPKALGAGRRRSEGWAFGSLALRFSLMALALGWCLYKPQSLSVAACAAGLFVVQLTLLTNRFLPERWREATWGVNERWKT